MSFAPRAIAGLTLTAVTVALVGAAAWQLHSAITTTEQRKRPPARERVYAVDAALLEASTVSPTIVAFGQVKAWKNLEIRAPAGGTITEISDNFRNGLAVEAGELLYRIDPEPARRRMIDAKAALSQARFELSEAKLSLLSTKADLSATAAQITIRERDLARKKGLANKRLATSTVLNDAELALATIRQTELAKRQAVVVAQSRIDKSKTSISRAELTLRDAEKTLRETTYRAPFAGRLTDVTATLGQRVSQNEKFGILLDPDALEVSFPVRMQDLGNLVEANNPDQIARLQISVALTLGKKQLVVDGVLDRMAAVATSQFGRTVFAKLTGKVASALRPGDFVTVTITEPPLDNVAVIPSAAATDDGRILLITDSDRLIEHHSRILRRQTNTLIVSDVPIGRPYVRLRLPFLSAGVKVKARSDSETTNITTSAPVDRPLDPSKRAAFIALVKSSTRMSEDRRRRLLRELAKPVPSERTVRRLERQLARQGRKS